MNNSSSLPTGMGIPINVPISRDHSSSLPTGMGAGGMGIPQKTIPPPPISKLSVKDKINDVIKSIKQQYPVIIDKLKYKYKAKFGASPYSSSSYNTENMKLFILLLVVIGLFIILLK